MSMIEEVVVKKKYCDWCGKTDDVESFYFFVKYMDSHGNNDDTKYHIELCRKCQYEAYDILKNHECSKKIMSVRTNYEVD